LKASEVSRICAEIEGQIESWVALTNGLVNKINTGRYMVFWEKENLEKVIAAKFDILDTVRNIPISDQMHATLSIGAACEGDSVRECYELSNQCLDMALGRGGDQAVLRLGTEYKFFGGVSSGHEKKNKVRTRLLSKTISEKNLVFTVQLTEKKKEQFYKLEIR
jgi:c-di-AMP phosphodiesterase-like protein